MKGIVSALYEYMRVTASHLVNPLIVSPDELITKPIQVKQDMKTNPRLELQEDPDKVSGHTNLLGE